MNWKEFFRPTLAKIVLLLILPTIFLEFMMPCDLVVGHPCTPVLYFPYPLGFVVFAILVALSTGVSLSSSNLILIPVDIVYTYVIACAIVFGYHKWRKK